jgi:hypothetical protein
MFTIISTSMWGRSRKKKWFKPRKYWYRRITKELIFHS